MMLSDTIDTLKNYYFPYGEMEKKRVANLTLAVISVITVATLITLQVNQTFAWNVAVHNFVQHQVVPFVMETFFSEISFGVVQIPVWMLTAFCIVGGVLLFFGLYSFSKPYKDNPDSIRDYLAKSAKLGDLFHVFYPDNSVTIYLAVCDYLLPNQDPVKVRLEGKTVKKAHLSNAMDICKKHWDANQFPYTLPATEVHSNYYEKSR